MKREHFDNIPKDIPFAENLVFYAPLTDTDLTEHISGQSMVYDSNYTVYDNDKQCWLFRKTSDYEAFFRVNVKPYMTNGGYTLFCQCQPTHLIYNLNFPGYFVIGGYRDTNSWRPCVQYLNTEPADKRELFLKRTRVFDCANDSISLYTDGVWFYDDTAQYIQYPENWTGNMLSRVAVNPYRESRDTIGAYVKDIRIYNRALSASEIAQL